MHHRAREDPAPKPLDAAQHQHDRSVADFPSSDYRSSADAARGLPDAGDGGTADVGAASAVPPPDLGSHARIRFRLRRRIAEPSDAARMIARYRREYGSS